jgi:hypothetical protein
MISAECQSVYSMLFIRYSARKITCPFGQGHRGVIMGAREHLTRREAVTLLEIIDAARCCADVAGFNRLIRSLDGLLSFDKAVCGIARLDGVDSPDAQRKSLTSPIPRSGSPFMKRGALSQ